MYQIGTVAELKSMTLPVPQEVYQEVADIANMLDERFGANRDIEVDEGGFIVIVLNDADMACFKERYPDLDTGLFEYVLLIKAAESNYLNVFYLYGYDYGISLFLPVSIAPEVMRKEVLQDV